LRFRSGSVKDPESLLVNILDPNRFVEPQYLQYVATDLKGGLYTGLLRDETATSVTLVEGDDLRNTLLRENIRELRATSNGFLPGNLGDGLVLRQAADDTEAAAELQARSIFPTRLPRLSESGPGT
jgi:hypothetical protein